MNETFNIGDRALLVPAPGSTGPSPADPYFGQVVIIVGGPYSTPPNDPHWMRYTGGIGYMIEASDGARLDCGIVCLQKLPPAPREQVSTWDDVIVWKPREVSHV